MPKNKSRCLSEADVARPVVDYLNSFGWTVYQEVETISGIADIVAVLDKRLWIVEVKKIALFEPDGPSQSLARSSTLGQHRIPHHFDLQIDDRRTAFRHDGPRGARHRNYRR